MRYSESESNTLEFKRELPRNDAIIKTLIGFCNQHGGRLIIGVNDDKTIVGLPEEELEKIAESVDLAAFQACSPSIIPRIYTQRLGDKNIMVIEVAEGMNKPYYRRKEGKVKGTYIRLGRHTVKATPEIIRELEWQSTGTAYEQLPVHAATKDDLDIKAISNFLKNRKNHAVASVTEESLKAYHLITYDQAKSYPTVLALLLFGRNPQHYLSEAMIICSHFEGKSGRKTFATVDCVGTLFDQFKQAYAFIIERLYRKFEIKGLKRDEQLEIPEIAIREALLNAVVHRNYHISAPTKIAIYDNRVEFFSPGQFPGPLRTENLLSGITYLRNPMLCRVLREVGYIEKLGTGFITIFSSYQKNDLATPQIVEGENFIKCILPREKNTERSAQKDDLGEILQLFSRHQEIRVTEVIQCLSISRATAIRRLNVLIEEGKIQRIGQKKSTRYKLK